MRCPVSSACLGTQGRQRDHGNGGVGGAISVYLKFGPTRPPGLKVRLVGAVKPPPLKYAPAHCTSDESVQDEPPNVPRGSPWLVLAP